MKNPNQDDAVERMLNQLEGLLNHQHRSARVPQGTEAPRDRGSHERQPDGGAPQLGADRRPDVPGLRFDAQNRARVQDLLADKGELDARSIAGSEYDPVSSEPVTVQREPRAQRPELEPHYALAPDPVVGAGPAVESAPSSSSEPGAERDRPFSYEPAITQDPAVEAELDAEADIETDIETEAHVEELEHLEGQGPVQAVERVHAGESVHPEPQPQSSPQELQGSESLEPESFVREEGTGMARRLTTRLGQLLVDTDLLSESELQGALNRQQETGQRLGEVLVNESYIDEPTLLSVLESQYGVPAVGLDDVDLDADLVKLVPHEMARRYLLVPLALHADAVDVAMVDPTDFVAMAHIRFATGLRPNVFIATVTATQRAIARLYTDEEVDAGTQPEDPREAVKRMILDRDSMLIAADQDPRKFYELAASIDAFVDEILRKASNAS